LTLAKPPFMWGATQRLFMLVLTWFGTIVRAETATKMLIHSALWPSAEESGDISFDVASRDIAEPVEVTGMPGVTMSPGPQPGTVHFRREQRVLRADPARQALVFVDAAAMEGPETFLLLEPAEALCLRTILAHAWTLEPHGARLSPAALRTGTGFGLHLGDMRLDLVMRRPLPGDDGDIVLLPAGEQGPASVLRRARQEDDPTPVVLRAGRRFRRVPDAPNAEAFRVTRDRRLALTGYPEYVVPPLTCCDTDSDWLFMQHKAGEDLTLGRQVFTSHVHREHGKLVLLASAADGLVFDSQGAASGGFRPEDIGADMPAWMQRNGDAIYIDRSALDRAPTLHGTYVIVGHSALQDRGRGRIETLLALDILGRYAPANATLLLPSALPSAQADASAEIQGLLKLLGFAELQAVMVDKPLVRVEEALWLEGGSVEQLPGRMLREFRARLPGPRRGKGRRLMIRQLGPPQYANEDVMIDFATAASMDIITLEDESLAEQMQLFSEAELVVAPHGPALANLLFSPPGTKVLEIAPDGAFRPYYWRLAGKLGLTHAVLPCPTTDRTLDGPLTVPRDRLMALYGMLSAKLA
jgi:capsular polysaccharide biosynthesis protein